MSMTKRMMERGGGTAYVVTAESEAASKAEKARRIDQIAAAFEITSKYHHAFVKSRLRPKQMDTYRVLYPHGRPSTTKFYGDLKQAGSLAAYLTHYFFWHLKQCLEGLGLPPHEVADLMTKTEDGRRFYLRIEAAGHYAPTEEQLRTAESIQPKPRQFRHHNRHIPSVMHDRAIQAFFTEMHAKNEMFYQAHPEALFRIELLDYQDYLQSPFWFVIRNIVLYRDSYKCRVCAAKATTVHHISYDADVLYGKNLEPLVSLCEPCHEQIEFDEAGEKVSDLALKKQRYESLRNNAAS